MNYEEAINGQQVCALILAWKNAFQNRPMLLSNVCKDAEKIPELYASLNGICYEDKKGLNVVMLGWFLKRCERKFFINHYFVSEYKGLGSLYWSLLPRGHIGKKRSMLQQLHEGTDAKNLLEAKKPLEPIPQDLQGDIHLMAMTILEKLQPVLLNAIYTELMEHKK